MGSTNEIDGGVAARDRARTIAAAVDDTGIEAPPMIGADERRMHVRAYNVWVAMLSGRSFPAIADLDPETVGDFAHHGVLLDFRADPRNPHIRWLGEALRREGDMAANVPTVADVPGRSLLSRLTDHCLQIIANRAPIGFEAEFVNVRGNTALYRGILMPFSSDGQAIDFIYGVINWKELADPETAAEIIAAARAAAGSAPMAPAKPIAPVWADGPSRSVGGGTSGPAEPVALADRLPLVREAGSAVLAAEFRARSALYRALGIAYDLAMAADADPPGYAALLMRAGLRAHPRNPWLPIVRLVFGDGLSRPRTADYAAVLAHAWRHDVAAGALRGFLENSADGIRGIVAAERACRRSGA